MEEEAFTKFLGGIFANGCVMMSLSLGSELGLFKFLCKAEKPLSVQDVVDGLQLKERYVREWLSCMVSAGILKQDPETRLYTVPEGHKPALLNNTGFAPVITDLGKRVPLMKRVFEKDGPWGISFQDDPDWFDSFNKFRHETCDKTVANDLIPMWKKEPGLIEKLEKGIKVLDLACGPGNLTNVMAQTFPKSTFVGLDYSTKAVQLANEMKAERGLSNIEFVEGDAHNLPADWTGTFDMVFLCDALHDLPNPRRGLEELYRVMKDDGCMSIMEVGFHSDPLKNADNFSAAMFYSMGMFICLTSSMCEPPHEGYGAMWGMEAIEETITSMKFKIHTKERMPPKVCYFCTK